MSDVFHRSDRATFWNAYCAEIGPQRQKSWWRCKCDCGHVHIVRSSSLRSGDSQSCGCSQGNLSHGECRNYERSPEYEAWLRMKQRCLNPNTQDYKNYGERG